MKPLNEVTACVIDHGRFVHVARTLGLAYGKVYFTSPEERDCPLSREACIGDGFPEIQRVKSLWDVKDECDIFVFPDVGFCGEQKELIGQGYPVFGAGAADALETRKGTFLRTLSQTDLPVPKYETIKGLSNLRLYLREAEDKYIKISNFRGDWETLHWTNYDDMEATLDSYSVRWGPIKDLIVFYVFEPIDTEIEDGVDSYCVNGQFPKTVLHGMECKDKGYIGTMQKLEDLPEEVRIVNEVFGPILGKMNGGSAMKFSTEVRITKDGKSYFIDPTCRFGSPPSQGECLLIKNLPEIIYRGAMRELIEPETDQNFVVQAHVTVSGDRTEWNSFRLDEELSDALKCGFSCQIDGKLCLAPITEYHTSEAGYLCATGDTLIEAIEKLRELKDRLPDTLKCEFSSIADILKEIHAAEEKDMQFTDQHVPEPEVILEEPA